jgi:hypothetical protein
LTAHDPYLRGIWAVCITAFVENNYMGLREVSDETRERHGGSKPTTALSKLVLDMEEELLAQKVCKDIPAAMFRRYPGSYDNILGLLRKRD